MSRDYDESVKNTSKSRLDGIIKDVKTQIRRHFEGYKVQIRRIGCALKDENLIKKEDICTEIKNALREEIKEKIISSDTIERCCPEEWKRKTKPKEIKEPQLRIFKDNNPKEQEIVKNVNANVTSRGQLLQQEFEQGESNKVEEQSAERSIMETRKKAQQREEATRLPTEQRSEKENEERFLCVECFISRDEWWEHFITPISRQIGKNMVHAKIVFDERTRIATITVFE